MPIEGNLITMKMRVSQVIPLEIMKVKKPLEGYKSRW